VSTRTVYGNLITFNTWDQRAPYNDRCPEVDGQRPPVGCAATSIAQIMNYWQYPNSLTFSSDDSYTTATRQLAIDATQYSFSDLSYNGRSPSNYDRARLSVAAGVAQFMDYDTGGSGAWPWDTHRALQKFGYNSSMRATFWDAGQAIQQIRASQPIEVFITKPGVGHAIVIDGYNSDSNAVHLNMGWNGSSDDWYSMPDGMPASYQSVTGTITDIRPDSMPAASAQMTSPSSAANISSTTAFSWSRGTGNCLPWHRAGQLRPVQR